jgi:hypothetical protein
MTMVHIKRSFKVALRVSHPSIDPEVISRELAIVPHYSHRAGHPKVTPRGAPLDGVFDHSSWRFDFDAAGVSDLSDFLSTLVEPLRKHASFFARMVGDGGRVEFFCGVFADGNWDEAYSHELLRTLATLSIDLRLDVYAQREDLPIGGRSTKR